MSLTIGTYLVYPCHGICVVTKTSTKSIANIDVEFVHFRLIDSNMNIMMRVSQLSAAGVRPLANKVEAAKANSILKSQVSPNNDTWNKRYRACMEKIKSGSLIDLAEVVRDLTQLKTAKDLSFGERKMLEHAQFLLNTELDLIQRSA